MLTDLFVGWWTGFTGVALGLAGRLRKRRRVHQSRAGDRRGRGTTAGSIWVSGTRLVNCKWSNMVKLSNVLHEVRLVKLQDSLNQRDLWQVQQSQASWNLKSQSNVALNSVNLCLLVSLNTDVITAMNSINYQTFVEETIKRRIEKHRRN